MAEVVGVVASIAGVLTFAVQLSKTLYDFGDAVNSAKEDSVRIARNIKYYAAVLELLRERLEADAPIYSRKALDLTEQLSKDSHELFDAIRELIPGDPPWDGPKWRRVVNQNIPWAFRKARARLLEGQLEYVKSTLTLMMSAVYAGKMGYQSARQLARIETALYEQFNAHEKLPALQEMVNEEENSIRDSGESYQGPPNIGTLTIRNQPVLSEFEDTYRQSDLPYEEKATRLREESSQWLSRMTKEWYHEPEAVGQLIESRPQESHSDSSRESFWEEIKKSKAQCEEGLVKLKAQYEEELTKLKAQYEELLTIWKAHYVEREAVFERTIVEHAKELEKIRTDDMKWREANAKRHAAQLREIEMKYRTRMMEEHMQARR
jgi:hypothetical protein